MSRPGQSNDRTSSSIFPRNCSTTTCTTFPLLLLLLPLLWQAGEKSSVAHTSQVAAGSAAKQSNRTAPAMPSPECHIAAQFAIHLICHLATHLANHPLTHLLASSVTLTITVTVSVSVFSSSSFVFPLITIKAVIRIIKKEGKSAEGKLKKARMDALANFLNILLFNSSAFVLCESLMACNASLHIIITIASIFTPSLPIFRHPQGCRFEQVLIIMPQEEDGHKHRTSCVLHFIFCLNCGPLTAFVMRPHRYS